MEEGGREGGGRLCADWTQLVGWRVRARALCLCLRTFFPLCARVGDGRMLLFLLKTWHLTADCGHMRAHTHTSAHTVGQAHTRRVSLHITVAFCGRCVQTMTGRQEPQHNEREQGPSLTQSCTHTHTDTHTNTEGSQLHSVP